MATLFIKDLEKTYKDSNFALSDFSFESASNEFVVILGPSGCGKTSLALAILKLQSNAKITGEILYQNTNLLELNEKQLTKLNELHKKV